MKTVLQANKSRGHTIVEMMVSLAVLMFIFSYSAALIFMAGRNVMNMRDQVASQTAAGIASERVVKLCRNSTHFWPVSGDVLASGTKLTRIEMINHLPNDTYTTSVLAWDNDKKILKYWPDSTVVTWTKSKDTTTGSDTIYIPNAISPPSYTWKHLSDFRIEWENHYRLRLNFFFQYRGFILYFQNPGNPQYGQFITDVIAKDHFIDQGPNYGDEKSTQTPFML